ncbi:hypothetical protein J132_06821 [Termitomyces sp. J132]|nr:hypothetical protein J132_06821 [Termitomyces sp. J132]
MSAFNPAYNPVGYPTDAYGRPILENSYAPFYPGPFTDQYVPRHWTPDPNQVFYAPSISQGIPPGWRHPPAFHADGNNPRINPGGYSAAPPNPAYLPPAHYYAYPIPAAAPAPPEATDNYSPPRPPFAVQTPPSPRQQRIEAYAQQRDEVLRFLRLSPAEFARRTRTFLTSLGYPDTSATPENTQGTLGLDENLWNELRTLVEEIHTSPNPHPFEDPLDPTRFFHVQREEPVGTQNEAPSSVPRQQEELNAASSILRNLNPVGGLFDQPAAHTLALSAQPRASSVPSAFRTWDQPAIPEIRSQRPSLRVNDDNRTLSYIDEPGNPTDEHPPRNGPQRDRPPHFDLRAPPPGPRGAPTSSFRQPLSSPARPDA